MANRQTRATAKQGDRELTVQQHETDSPILPVGQLRELHDFRPDAVDWVLNESQKESDFRRKETHRVNSFVYMEMLIGQIFALIIGLGGIVAGSYVTVNGQPAAGGTIASLAITGLAVVFLTGRKKSKS